MVVTGSYSCAQKEFLHSSLNENLTSVLRHDKRDLFTLISTFEDVKIMNKNLVSFIFCNNMVGV